MVAKEISAGLYRVMEYKITGYCNQIRDVENQMGETVLCTGFLTKLSNIVDIRLVTVINYFKHVFNPA
jgi:hypothetical protein